MLTSVTRETTPVTSTPTAATSTEPTSVSVKVASQETDLCAFGTYRLLLWHIIWLNLEDAPLVQFMYLVFTRMPGGSYRRRLGSLLLCLFDDFSRAN